MMYNLLFDFRGLKCLNVDKIYNIIKYKEKKSDTADECTTVSGVKLRGRIYILI